MPFIGGVAEPCDQATMRAQFSPIQIARPAEIAVSTISDGMPLLPLSSRMVRASSGSAGAHFGLKMAQPTT